MKPEDPAIDSAMTHALGWMFFANLVGVWLAVLLLFPPLGKLMGEWTYGRWVPVHLNLHLYGWSSLPLIGALFSVYGVQKTAVGKYARSMVWLWSLALAMGVFSWLTGVSSGKIFLDWRGVSCVLFIAVLAVLWILLAVAWWKTRGKMPFLGLLGLLPVPFMLYLATRQDVYPPVNPDTGGPTGASLLGSTLSIIFLLLILPRMCGCEKKSTSTLWARVGWSVFAFQAFLMMVIKTGNSSHHEMEQILSLGTLLLWIPIMPCYFNQWSWREGMTGWRTATLAWLTILILTGWMSFLPGWLDHLKFSNGLVAHSHLAMAGFVTSFLMLLMGHILPEKRVGGLSATREFFFWQAAVASYVILMWYSGFREGNDAGFIMSGGVGMHTIYALRLLCGLVMLWASSRWWLQQLSYEQT